jgi:hypothetical protein
MLRKMLSLGAVVTIAVACWAADSKKTVDPGNLVQNPDFRLKDASGKPTGWQFTGGAEFAYPGNPRFEVADWGAGLKSSEASGSVSQLVKGVDGETGKWFRFTVRGLPQQNFAVGNDNLYMKVEFLGEDGKTEYDGKDKKIYDLVEQERKDLAVNGIRKENGAESWHLYQMDFMLPFPQVHSLKLSVGFGDGAARENKKSEFFVTDFSLMHIPDPTQANPEYSITNPAILLAYSKLIPIGGRWYYAAAEGETSRPSQFDYTNANRLLYKDAGYSAPFAGNTTAWLHKGNIDKTGATVQADRFVPDNLVISFDSTSMILKTHCLPNHPTGNFPSRQSYDEFKGNPNSITEAVRTYYIPLEPRENPNHVATATDNSNHALPMGPIGIAINGVVFFNPFDAGSQDATDLMDRCCGHPAPDGQYHYHKYPICVNSPWADEGKEHSPLIGFAFDGFPVYGPYVAKDLMAKDATGEQGLNEFNGHSDSDRGFHYQVTPGKFPYLIGGYWGTEDPRDVHRGGRGGGGMMGGRGGHNGQQNGQQGGGPPDGGPPGGGPPPGGASPQ